MSNELVSRIEKLGLSNRELGQRVHDLWQKRAPEERNVPKPESIAVKLGELQHGKPTWWNNHHEALEAIAEILGCTPDELLASSHAPATGIEFAEFAELPPLGPTQEPCAFDEHGWLGTHAFAALAQGVHVWYVAPAGTGKTLTIQYLKQRYPSAYMTFTARSLIDVAPQADPKMPVVVEIEVADPATDVAALQELTTRRTNTCILAPFGRPALEQKDRARWTDLEFYLDSSWRERLIRWTHGRLSEPTQLDVVGLLEWLEDVDPQVKLFSTPGALLPMIAWCYRKQRAPSQKEKLDVLADEYLTRHFNAHAERNPFLQRSGRKIVDALTKRRLTSIEVPHAALSRDAWVALIPDALVPSPSVDEVERQVKALRRERASEAREKREAEVIATATAGRASEIIDRLVECGVLSTQANGHFDIHPAWVRRGLERRAWMHALLQEKPQQWGLLAADISRKLEVDEILDALAPSELVDLAKRTVDEPISDLGVVAAIEALFAAFARRMILKEWLPAPPHIPILQILGQRQANLLCNLADLWDTRLPIPITRLDIYEAAHPINIFEAWAFSLRVPQPSVVHKRLHWVFPGWAKNLRLSDAPAQLDYPHSWNAQQPLPEHARNTTDLAVLARVVLQRCVDEDIPPQVNRLMLPWLIIDGHPIAGLARPEHWDELVHWGAGETLAKILETENENLQHRIILELWSYLKKRAHDGHPMWALLRQQDDAPVLYSMLVRHLPPTTFAADLAQKELNSGVIQALDRLPTGFRRVVLETIAKRFPNNLNTLDHDLGNFMDALGLEDLDLLVQFVSYQYSVGRAAANRVFAIAPERALLETHAAFEQGSEIALIWIYEAPLTCLPRLVEMLDSHRGEHLSRMRRWLARNLANAGALAPRIFRLLQRASTAT